MYLQLTNILHLGEGYNPGSLRYNNLYFERELTSLFMSGKCLFKFYPEHLIGFTDLSQGIL